MTCPLSPPQIRLWLMSQIEGANSAYNIPGVFRLSGPLDVDSLQHALSAVQARHEILRTTFDADEEGRPFQRIHASFAVDFARVSHPAAGSDDKVSEKVIREVILEAFDLRQGPTWRARLFSLGEQDHVLILSFHHIVFDGWSLGVLARELFESYAARLGEAGPVRADPLYQYTDYVAWRERDGAAKTRDNDTAYWREALSGDLPLLELPADFGRFEVSTYRGSIHKLVLSRKVFDDLVALARKEGTTPYTAFLSLLKILLYRYTGQEDLIVGTPVSGRNRAEIEPLIGIFINTLPLRSRLSSALGFREVLQRVRASSLDAFAHQDLPFDAIVEAVNPPRLPSYNPIFQVLYTYQNALAPLVTGPLTVRYMDVDCGTAKFDLSLDVYEGVDGPTCIFEYNTDLFLAERIERMAGHFAQLIEAVLANPDAPISGLRIMTEHEMATVHASLYAPRLPVPYRDFVSLFERQVRAHGHACAVSDGAVDCSYGALDAQANRIAHALRARGVQQGQVVGVCLPRSTVLIAAVIGVMKAGAAFVALEPSYPSERLALMAKDSSAACIICNAQSASVAARIDCLNLDLDHDRDEIACYDMQPPAVTLMPEDVAYVVYTSGTTGKPKGVMVTHGNYMNAYFGWEKHYRLDRLNAHLQIASFPFDVFCGDLVRALGSGKTLVICPHDLFAAPDALYALMKDKHVDFAEFVPAVFRTVADYLLNVGARLDFMQVLVVASDNWYVGEYRRYRALLGPEGRLINSYGTAEATIDSTLFEGDVEDVADGTLVPIGKPFPNVEVLVTDKNLQPLPVGIVGEICVGGAGVARGYINRPDLNAEKFVPHPCSLEQGARLYRTGDLGRLRADGAIELFGRRDTQVKIRGMRIELGEIEMALRSKWGQIQNCAVMVREDEPGDRRIVAYLACDEIGMPAPEALNTGLAECLPTYMIPSAYVELKSLPLSANGKVDRNKLPACDDGRAEIVRGFVSPRTLSEEMLATIWVQVFNIPRVGVYDSFFALGGHSLLAFQLVAKIREVFELDISLQTLFINPTIAGLATAISELQGKRDEYDATINALPVVVSDPMHRHQPFPLTEVQQAYWLGRNEVFEFGNVTTHSYDEMETDKIDVPRFQRAWNKVIARHDMLHAVILHDGTQQILPSVPEYAVRVLDFRNNTKEEADAGIETVRNEMSHQMLDVHRWPVFDVRVTLLPNNRARIHFSNDALIFDVWSFVIIIEDLVKLYLEEDAVLPDLTLSFRDYVIAEEKIRTTERYRRSLGYWRGRVENLAPAPDLPMVMDPSLLKKPRFTRLHATLDREAWGRLKQKAVRAGLTTTGLMLAAYAEVLAAYSSDPAFSLNLTFLNRHPMHPQVNDIVGEFTSLTLLGVDQSVGRTFADRARKVQSDLWNDLEHHDISGIQVLRDLTRSRGGERRAKMPVVFTSALVVPIPKRKQEFPIIPVYRDGVTQTSQVWLDCGVWEDDHILLCNWDVVLDLYPEGMIEEMFAAYWTLVRRLADDKAAWSAEISDLRPESGQARKKQDDVSLPALPVSDNQTLDSLFLASLARQPEASAIILPTRTLTYRELARHAAWVRRQVTAAGVKRGELVAVVMNKGWEQVAATLGIMNSSAAYMPIDPALPDQRVRTLLKEGRVTTVITTSDLAARLTEISDVTVIAIDHDCSEKIELLQEGEPAKAEDIAYVIFTSGSTGKPKGVVINHRGAVNTLQDVINTFNIGASDRVISLSSLSFDLSVFDFFGALAAGSAIVLPNNERRLDPSHWSDLVAEYGVTVWNSVPALCGLMVDFCEKSGRPNSAMRHVMLSGDWIPVTLPDRIRSVFPQAQITSLGGATESSIWSIWYPINEVGKGWTSIPYGRPMRGQDVRVLDHRLEECPTWVSGEIFIAGIGLALGYWNDEELTANAFVTHPRSGERLYRTGDLGRCLADGNIEFLGRRDQQVKVQGFRIELGEIEAAILKHPAIRNVVVVCKGERHAEKHLGAFYCLHPEQELDLVELRSFLITQLPGYMVPHVMHELPSLPLSTNGKVDRKALPNLEATPNSPAIHVAPRDEAEETIAQIWQGLLSLSRVSVNDDFFRVGGDSMLAIKLMLSLRQTFNCNVALKHAFQCATVADQAVLIRSLSDARSEVIA